MERLIRKIEPVTQSALTPAQLDTVAARVQKGRLDEHHPAPQDRLFWGQKGLRRKGSFIILPHGPWEVRNHPNRVKALNDKDKAHLLDPELPQADKLTLPPNESRRWLNAGYLVDQYGQPVHPVGMQMMHDSRIGALTGKATYWLEGENESVTVFVDRRRNPEAIPEFLLIRRSNGGKWAFVGGYRDASDNSSATTARRELKEETGLSDVGGSSGNDLELIKELLIGPGASVHALSLEKGIWINGTNQEYLFDTEPHAGSDAIDVGWFTKQEIQEIIDHDELYQFHFGHVAVLFEAAGI